MIRSPLATFGQQGAGTDHGRQFQPFGQDRRVAAFATRFGHESQDPVAIQPSRFAGRQVVSQDDGRCVQVDRAFLAAVQQVVQQPLFQVEQVVGPFGQIGVAHLLKDAGIAPQRAMDRHFGRHLLADLLLQLLVQMRIFEHLAVGREDGAVLLAQLIGDRLPVPVDLDRHGLDRAVEARQLGIDRVAIDGATRDDESLVFDDQRFANGNAGRNGNSLQYLHRSCQWLAIAAGSSAASRQRRGAIDRRGSRNQTTDTIVLVL